MKNHSSQIAAAAVIEGWDIRNSGSYVSTPLSGAGLML